MLHSSGRRPVYGPSGIQINNNNNRMILNFRVYLVCQMSVYKMKDILFPNNDPNKYFMRFLKLMKAALLDEVIKNFIHFFVVILMSCCSVSN